MKSLDTIERVAGHVSRETADKIELYVERLKTWNQRINLISPADLDEIWERHIRDCAQLIQFHRPGAIWLDLGSGAGLPGMVLALLLGDFGGGRVHLVESNRKKTSFLLSVIAETQAPASVHPRRIEEVYPLVDRTNFITARALAPLPKLLELAEPWLTEGAEGVFLKGREYGAELQQCDDAWDFALLLQESKTDSSAKIVQIKELRRKNADVVRHGE